MKKKKKFRNQISIGLKYNQCTFIVHNGHCYNLESVWSVFDLSFNSNIFVLNDTSVFILSKLLLTMNERDIDE